MKSPSKLMSAVFTCGLLIFALGCSSGPAEKSDLDLNDSSLDSSASSEAAFDDVEKPSSTSQTTEPSSDSTKTSDSLEDEFAQAEGQPAPAENAQQSTEQSGELSSDEASSDQSAQQAAAPQENQSDEFSEFEEQVNQTADQPKNEMQQTETLAQEPPPPTIEPEIAEPPLEPIPEVAAKPIEPPPEVVPTKNLAQITGLKYRPNESGGTFIIESNSNLSFTTRKNETTNQLIIEVPDAKLKESLQRSINTRDLQGSIGSIDPYQNKNGTTARFVVQLRSGYPDPVVSSEGNSIVVVGSPKSEVQMTSEPNSDSSAQQASSDYDKNTEALSSAKTTGFDSANQSLEEYLSTNTEFSGRKISIEANVDIKEFFKLLTDEIGVNFVISEGVQGNVNIKLKQVPWDQALIVVMKSKKLGYTKIGNILRIAPLAEIQTEEVEAQKAIAAKKLQSPLKVKLIPISYAKVTEVQTQITPFLTEARGKVTSDARTSSIIVTDTEEAIERILKIIRAIDTPTQQVLIEGKIVEANENFARSFSSSFGTSLQWRSGSTQVRIPTTSGDSTSVGGTGLLKFSITRIPEIGSISAALGLAESEQSIEILSSPRIITLNNEAATISQTTRIPTLKTSIGTNGQSTSEPNYVDVKLNLDVTPQVTNDNSVILQLSVNRDIPGAAVSGAGGAPGIESRTARTKVMVKNGQTAVVGGIYQLDTTEGEVKVPFLGDIPVLGWLFKSTTNARKKNELMIFVTPEILTQSQSETNTGTDLN